MYNIFIFFDVKAGVRQILGFYAGNISGRVSAARFEHEFGFESLTALILAAGLKAFGFSNL